MSDPPAVSVSAEGEATFRVVVGTVGASTTHTVEVPAGMAARLGWEGEEAELVRRSFLFLLEREPAGSILRRFRLDVIRSYFPDYDRQLQRGDGPR